MDLYLGIDCGATNLRIGVVNLSGELVASSFADSPLKHQPRRLAWTVKFELDKIAKLQLQGEPLHLLGIGLGTPGPIDRKNGLIFPSANLGNSAPIDLKTQFAEVFGDIDISFDRDTNIALLGESWKGTAQGLQEVVMLSLGTGIGGAVMTGGEVYHGAHGWAGEIGHAYLSQKAKVKSQKLKVISQKEEEEDVRCGLGHQGCFEAWMNQARDLPEMAEILGLGLANIVNIFDPQAIILIGGKLKAGDFITPAITVMKEKGLKPGVDKVEVKIAQLGDLAGVYGAACSIFHR